MALVPRLDLRQVQSLVMTPQLQQAIKLLQLSNLELSEYVERELEQNPLLEREDADGHNENSEAPQEDSAASADGESPAAEVEVSGDGGDDTHAENLEIDSTFGDAPAEPDSMELVDKESIALEHDAGLDADYENVWSGDTGSDAAPAMETDTLNWQVRGAGGFDADNPELENAPADEISLRDHLLEQINVDLTDPVDRLVAVYMVDSLDESGYLTVSTEDIAVTLGCPHEHVEKTLERVQRFDPSGIFARDLAECLALQLRDLDRFDPAMRALIENLDVLAKREFKTLRRLCGVDNEDIVEMIKEIQSLNPKPALIFDHSVAQAVTPDVSVRRGKDGSWFVEVNSDTLPRVLFNNRYYTEINNQALGEKDKVYIAECYQSANWLVKALHQRAQTIMKVAAEIVRRQEEFLERGVQYLKPLVLREVAETLDIHESTVSRVTNNKYINTPRGIFELKYFFTFAVGENADGESSSAEAVRFQIKNLIEAESLDNVLSDDKIVSILKDEGVDIARRTVAKYREAMHIPSSVQRRREKTLHA
ncbi:MAG: RNA polymerase sigma-54 factor [Rhodospirillaceae bacterium]|nr:RNA polymerase sigma-54 factor [Rhodospirillaceae bacterium]|tara:strand:- start:46673 stop:48286 length:1614 start_codon:yes stop_codon:yes gene_type:complete